ncbi:glutathione S-transferas-like protein [Ophiobolus disseminans]|uniref:Glutathione S-transferas-like protein n=1 Tax=Ophiobolus disseminans TaxID=1469910 RepID=A0A6A6ZX19_9PLEO|nr:glutathione S-transferas-like protein [Ophiobolus disseminans]
MVLTVHHLGVSQSERILFLCEELSIDYKIVHHTRDPIGAPQSLKDVPGNATGKAPFIEDSESGITLQESGAICEYILAKNAAGQLGSQLQEKRLFKTFGEEGYADYLYWYHWSNSTFQALLSRFTFFEIGQIPSDNAAYQFSVVGLDQTLAILNEHLAQNKWLAGHDFTAADIMTIYSLTSKRYFGPLVSYAKYANILRYLKDIGERPAYRRAMEKGDPEMRLLLGSEAPAKTLLQVGGVGSDIWRKTGGSL